MLQQVTYNNKLNWKELGSLELIQYKCMYKIWIQLRSIILTVFAHFKNLQEKTIHAQICYDWK